MSHIDREGYGLRSRESTAGLSTVVLVAGILLIPVTVCLSDVIDKVNVRKMLGGDVMATFRVSVPVRSDGSGGRGGCDSIVGAVVLDAGQTIEILEVTQDGEPAEIDFSVSQAHQKLLAAALQDADLFYPGVQGDPGTVLRVIHPDPPIDPKEYPKSVGLAFDGVDLYFDRRSDPNIYRISTVDGEDMISSFDSGIAELPNALTYDAKRNGLWIGCQLGVGGSGIADCGSIGMPIYFWDFDDDSVTLKFTIPLGLVNPATGEPFLDVCYVDGLAYNENNPSTDADDELWFSDDPGGGVGDMNRNVGVFTPNGTLVNGFDSTEVHPALSLCSGLEIAGNNLYMASPFSGVFRANLRTDPLTLVDQFVSDDLVLEDMALDRVTFAPTEAMWVRTSAYGVLEDDVITAYEIETRASELFFVRFLPNLCVGESEVVVQYRVLDEYHKPVPVTRLIAGGTNESDLVDGLPLANFESVDEPVQELSIPTVSNRALTALVMLLLAGVAIKFGRRQPAQC